MFSDSFCDHIKYLMKITIYTGYIQIIYNADVYVYKTVAVWCNFYLFKETLKILIYNCPTSVKISAD